MAGIDSQEIFMVIGTGLAFVLALIYAIGRNRNITPMSRFIFLLITAYAIFQIILVVVLWINHINFPLNLEVMELTILQHVKRAAHGLPIYVEPSAEFIALDYNPLYYFLAVPFTWIFGEKLLSLRLVSILGVLGSGIVIFLAVRKHTSSNWWGLIATGLFCGAYRVMDSYLDNALPDSWLLFVILLGCYLIDLNRSRNQNLLGVFLVITAFWFKQYGAIFAVGAVLYLTWRDGLRNSWPYWLIAIFLGPILYFAIPSWLFGPQFHYYTWEVPSHWIQFDWDFTVFKFIKYIFKYYFWLFLLGSIALFLPKTEYKKEFNIWFFMLPVAVLNGLFVSLDPGRNNNLYIPMGAWFIVTGVIGLKLIIDRYPITERMGLHIFMIAASFVLFFYNPRSEIVPSDAQEAYQDLQSFLYSLDGPVYAPWYGQLQDGYQFSPAAHWVPLTDLFRDPSWNLNNHPITRQVLEPVIFPQGSSYILTAGRLEDDAALSFLAEDYILYNDFGDRFLALKSLPKLIGTSYPRFLYRYAPQDE